MPPTLPPRRPTRNPNRITNNQQPQQPTFTLVDHGVAEVVPNPPGDLPTYDKLKEEAESQGGSDAQRFGRWRGWIEKRAGERHLDEQLALEEMVRENRRRSNLGWGAGNYAPRNSEDPLLPPDAEAALFNHSPLMPHQSISARPAPPNPLLTPSHPSIQSIVTTATSGHRTDLVPLSPVPIEPTPAIYQPIGYSRFVPHLPLSAGPPQCLVPLEAPYFLVLLGTKTGLWVFDLTKGEEARCILEGVGVKDIKLLADQHVYMLCEGLEEDDQAEIRVWKWESLKNLTRWVACLQEAPQPFHQPIQPTVRTPSFPSTSANSSLSLSVPLPLRSLAGALQTQHPNHPLLQIRSSLSESIKRLAYPPPTDQAPEEPSMYVVQASDIPELPPRSDGPSPFPTQQTGFGTEEVWGLWADDWETLSLPDDRAGFAKGALVQVWEGIEGEGRPVGLLAVAGRGTISLFGREGTDRLRFSKEFYLPPQTKPLSALSFIHYLPTSINGFPTSPPTPASIHSDDEFSTGSLSLFLNFSGIKAVVVDLNNSSVSELEWPKPGNGNGNGNGGGPGSPTKEPEDEWSRAKEKWSAAKGKGRMRGSLGAGRLDSFVGSVGGRLEGVDGVKALVSGVFSGVGGPTANWVGGVGQVDLGGKPMALLSWDKKTGLWPIPVSIPLGPPIHTFSWPHPPSSLTYTQTDDTLVLSAIYTPPGLPSTIDCQSVPVSLFHPDGQRAAQAVKRGTLEIGKESGFFKGLGCESGGGRRWGWELRGLKDWRVFALDCQLGGHTSAE